MPPESDDPPPTFILEIDFQDGPPPARRPRVMDFDPDDVLKVLGPELEAKNLTRLKFAHMLARAIEQCCPQRRVVSVSEAGIIFRYNDGDEHIGLDNVWQLCSDARGERGALLHSAIASIAQSAYEEEARLEDVVTLVRSQSFFEAGCAELGHPIGSDNAPFGRTIAPGLVCMLAAESEYSLRFLTNEQIKNLGVNLNDLQAGPVRTMISRIPSNEIKGFHLGSGIYMITTGGDFESSLIVDEKLMLVFEEIVEGNLIFAVPNRDIFLIVNDSNPDTIAELRSRVAKSFTTSDRPISKEIYTWREGTIEVLPKGK